MAGWCLQVPCPLFRILAPARLTVCTSRPGLTPHPLGLGLGMASWSSLPDTLSLLDDPEWTGAPQGRPRAYLSDLIYPAQPGVLEG